MRISPTIFIVDDDDDERKLLEQAFLISKSDCRLRFFVNGSDLLDFLKLAMPIELPALILLDLNMPIMNGFETLTHLKATPAFKSIPVLVLTVSTFPEDIWRSYDLGVNAFLTKPNTFSKLVELVQVTDTYWLHSVRIPLPIDENLN